jgi:hypothetical protein
MDVKILLPKRQVKIDETERIYFLAGPIRGADDWQAKAIQLIAERDPGCTVACPCRYNKDHPLFGHSIVPELNAYDFPRQTLWEREYIMHAMLHGCLIFWLPCESKTNPRPKDQGPYARDTYGEIGRYFTHKAYQQNLRIVLGAEKQFPGLDQILCNLSVDIQSLHTHVWSNLPDTIESAVWYAKNSH